jgi:hypothetical protein
MYDNIQLELAVWISEVVRTLAAGCRPSSLSIAKFTPQSVSPHSLPASSQGHSSLVLLFSACDPYILDGLQAFTAFRC